MTTTTTHGHHNEDMFSLTLIRDQEDSTFKVVFIDIRQPNHRHRITLSKNNEIGTTLSSWLAVHVRELLARIDRSEMLISEPDAVLELPGLVLGRLKMLVHTSLKKVRQVIVRYTYFVGGIQSALKLDTHFEHPVVTKRDALSVAVLSDICNPAFEILSADVGDTEDPLTADRKKSAKRLMDRKEELAFYVELLRRYVETGFAWIDEPDQVERSISNAEQRT